MNILGVAQIPCYVPHTNIIYIYIYISHLNVTAPSLFWCTYKFELIHLWFTGKCYTWVQWHVVWCLDKCPESVCTPHGFLHITWVNVCTPHLFVWICSLDDLTGRWKLEKKPQNRWMLYDYTLWHKTFEICYARWQETDISTHECYILSCWSMLQHAAKIWLHVKHEIDYDKAFVKLRQQRWLWRITIFLMLKEHLLKGKVTHDWQLPLL